MMEECRAENCKAKHPHKRFCVHGHDTFEVGRRSNGGCRECYRLLDRQRASRSERVEARREYQKSEAARRGQRTRRQRPDVRAQRAAYDCEYRQRPDVRARRAAYMREINAREETRERKRRYKQRMPFEVYHRELLSNRRRLALKRLEQAVGASD